MLILAGLTVAVLAILLLAGLYWRWQQRGLLLGSLFLITVIFAYASGLAFVYTGSSNLPQTVTKSDFFIGAIIGALFFLVGVLISIRAVETFRGLSRTIGEIFGRLLQSSPRRGGEWQVVDGAVRQTRAPDPGATAAGTIIIPKNYAVIFEESSGKFTRVEFGPNVVSERGNDRPMVVVATRPRFKRFSISNLMAADGLIIDRVDFSLFYELQRDQTLSSSANIQHPISEETLLKAVYGVAQLEDGTQSDATTWQTAVEEIAENMVRAEFAKSSLLELFEIKEPATEEVKQEVQPASISKAQQKLPVDTSQQKEKRPSAMQSLATSIMDSVNSSIRQWGAVVNTLRIDYVLLPQQVQKRLEERWMSERKRAIQVAEGKAEGERIKEVEAAKGVAWAKLIGQMSRELGVDKTLAIKYISILEYLDSSAQAANSQSTTVRLGNDQLSSILGLEQKERNFDIDVPEKGGANIVGNTPEENKPPGGTIPPEEMKAPEEKGESDEAAKS